MPTTDMNLIDLTPQQLKRAASIKEQIDGLNRQLRAILGAPATPRAAPSIATEKETREAPTGTP